MQVAFSSNPSQKKLYALSVWSTWSANHWAKPDGVVKNLYKMVGDEFIKK